jgi:hypothetical protein
MKRVDLFSVHAADSNEIMKMQTKLNQWLTTGILIKYEIHTAGEYIVFNVCRKKEQG